MANIVQLNPIGSEARSAMARRVDGNCEIIIFPGVRYERWAEAPPPAAVEQVALRKPRAKKRAVEMAD